MLKATGTIRLIDTALPSNNLLGHCLSIEKPITWNQKGDPGAAGAIGPAGPKGNAGAPGTNGTNGAAGLAGAKGDAGEPGTNGTNGVDGTAGAQGPKGDPCLATDPACRGPKGDTGDVGPAGPPGTGGSSSVTLASLEGSPCGAPGGAQGAVRVAYATSLQSDAITLTCSHPVNTSFLDIYGSCFEHSYECGTIFHAQTCYSYDAGRVTVSPADLNGHTTCQMPDDASGYQYTGAFLCFFTFVQGTTVTVTATAIHGTFAGWGTPYGNHQPTECAGTTAPSCSVVLGGHRSVLARFQP